MSIVISLIALIISGVTFWLTRIKKGSVRMTRPTIICFVPQTGNDPPKIFIRTLLYNTSDRGQYLQNMFIRLGKDGLVKNFNIWAYGDKGIVRGSGLYVDKNGIGCYHHFLLPKTEAVYQFSAGEYKIEIFAEAVNKNPKKIFEHNLVLQDFQPGNKTAIYFDWEADKHGYYPHFDIGGGLPTLT